MILTAVTAEILLALFVQPNTNVGPLLYELRRYQDAMSAIL